MILIDTNIFMYAAGTQHTNKKACVKLLENVIASGNASEFATNTEVLQEILHRYSAIGKQEVGFEIFELVLNLQITIYPIELLDLSIAKQMIVKYPKLSTRDCVHLGMATRRNFQVLLTCDKGFSSVEELKIVHPKDL